MLKVYGFPKVNAVARGITRDLRVLWALQEMQLPFELVGIDHSGIDPPGTRVGWVSEARVSAALHLATNEAAACVTTTQVGGNLGDKSYE